MAGSAGPRRNREMAQCADALIAVYDGQIPGTGNMIETARELGLIVCVCACERCEKPHQASNFSSTW